MNVDENMVVVEGFRVLPGVARKIARIFQYPEISDLMSEGYYQIGRHYTSYDLNKGTLIHFWWKVLYRKLLLFVVRGEGWIHHKRMAIYVGSEALQHHRASVYEIEHSIFVQALLKSLRAEDQNLLWLRYAEEWTTKEIVLLYGGAESGLRTKLKRLKEKIRRVRKKRRYDTKW